MRAIATFILSALASGTFATGAVAQSTNASDDWTVRGWFENDLFAGTDQYYTNGVRLDVVRPANDITALGRGAKNIANWLFNDPPGATWTETYSVGQEIYTPKDLTQRIPDPEDRPYAGFLHASLGIVSDDGRDLETLALDLGVVGKWAQADDAQRIVHDTITGDDPLGWRFQLRNEPAVRLTYERRPAYNTLFDISALGLKVDYGYGYALALGNVDTSASVGGTVRIGKAPITDLQIYISPLQLAIVSSLCATPQA
ncbi:MAG: lipid A deacylase LpxR family protein [Pseudomonadota bacterium]